VSEPRPGIRGSAVATGHGDDGTTGLLYVGVRVYKDDLRADAFGTIDEAVAALGLARSEIGSKVQYGTLPQGLTGMADLIVRLQRELFVVGAEIATPPDAWNRLVEGETMVSETMVEGLEQALSAAEAGIELPREFVVPGETRLSAGLELARTIVRRAERRAVTLQRADLLAGKWLVPYLNRLADLLWVLARAAEAGEAHRPTAARVVQRSRRRPAVPR